MKKNTSRILRTSGTVFLLVLVSGIYTYRKYYRKQLIRRAHFEQSEAIMKQSNARQQKEREAQFVEQQNKQKSARQAQQNKLDSLAKASEEILKSFE